MDALRKWFSPSIIFTSIASSIPSLWKKKMAKDDHDPPPTPNAVGIPQQPLIRSSGTNDVIHGDVIVDVEAPPPPNIAPTSPSPSSWLGLMTHPQLISTSSPTDLPSASTPTINNHIRKMVAPVAIFLMSFATLLIFKPPDISLMSDTHAKSMASVYDLLLYVTFCFGACLILHCLMCVHPSDHLKDIWVQKYLMLMGVVSSLLPVLLRPLDSSASSATGVLGLRVLALLIVILAFAVLRMVSDYEFSAGVAAPDLAAGGTDNSPV